MTATPLHTDAYDEFREGLMAGGLEGLRAGLIGKSATVDGPFGRKPLLYADYVASGRALSQVESFVLERVLPYYANTHTEASYTGAHTTALRETARGLIAKACNANDEYAVVFTGSGATAGLNRLVMLCGVPKARLAGRPVRILHGPYEHHSNILPWRESGAEVIEIPEAPTGGPDMDALRLKLEETPAEALVIGTFSAASNVTGATTDVAAVTRLLQHYGARSIWDYAGGGAYLPINMRPARGVTIDAISVSAHKFLGGPGASGVMILRRSVCDCAVPSWPGGGTVRYVSPSATQYSDRIEDREEAGTPNIIGDIRAGLAFVVKDILGLDYMKRRHEELTHRGLNAVSRHPGIRLLGNPAIPRLPIFSMTFTGPSGAPVHYQLATRLLSDLHGIQSRGGCACAGPYAHRLLDFGPDDERRIMGAIALGYELEKPGFVRVNLSALMTDAEVARILDALRALPQDAETYASVYNGDPATGMFAPVPGSAAVRRPARNALLARFWPPRNRAAGNRSLG